MLRLRTLSRYSLQSSLVARPLGMRAFSAARTWRAGHGAKDVPTESFKTSTSLDEVSSPNALFGPGGKDGEIPTDYEQATGLERFEFLGKLQGIEVFDDQPLIQDRKGTPDDPVLIDSYDRVRYIGCTGFPAGSSNVSWLKVEEGKVTRDWESGCCYTLNYIGPDDEPAHH